MAAIDFPASPSVNQTHTASGVTWTWDGTSWKAQGSTTTYNLPTASTGTLGGIKVGDNFAIDGSGSLSLSAVAISGLTDVTAASADYLMLWDATDSSLKKVDAGELLGGGGGGSGITVQDEGSSLSTAGTTLNFVGSGVVASGTGSTKTITISGGGGGSTAGINTLATSHFNHLNIAGLSTFTGIGTFSNDLYVGGNLSVLGSTNLDSQTVNTNNLNVTGVTTYSGITTYTKDVHFGGVGSENWFWAHPNLPNSHMVWKSNVAGGNGGLFFSRSNIYMGAENSPSRSHIDIHGDGSAGHLRLEQYMDYGDNPLRVYSDFVHLHGSPTSSHSSRDIADFEYLEGTKLYHTGIKRFHTSGVGVTVYGQLDATSANFTGNVSIAGTLTYEDVKNVDSIGLVTARTGLVSPYADIDDFVSVGSNIHLGNAGVITATSYQGSGANLTSLNASNLGSGTVPTARLGSGTANNSVFLRGDNTWATPSGGGSGISNLIDDTTPELGGHLNLNSKNLTGAGTFTGTPVFDCNLKVNNNRNLQIGTAGAVSSGGSGDVTYSHAGGGLIRFESNFGIEIGALSGAAFRWKKDTTCAELWHGSGHMSGTQNKLKLTTATSGVSIVGTTTTGQLAVTGVSTFTGVINANATDIDDWIDVGNNIQLGNAGVVTATSYVGSGANLTALNGSNISSGTIAAARVATLNQDTSGNAATATALATARTIGGVSFDGSANINLPGVNASGTQDTSGTAALATEFTVTANNSTDETVYPLFVDGSTGSQGAETDTGLTYNPSTGLLTSTSFAGNITGNVTGNCSGTSGGFTAGSASNLNAGTLPDARFPSTLPAASGANLTSLNASNLGSGTVPTARLGSGTASNSVFLRGDNTWASVGGITDIVNDTTPQLGGNLDLNSKTINGTGTINITGAITATSFSGELAYHTAWTLGASGSSHYTFTGNGLDGAENDPTIYVIRGQKYAFKNRSGGHPFRIQTSFQNTSGTAYNDGVTNNSAGNGTDLIWNVQFDAPDVLYYQCTAHTNMSGKIIVLGSNVTAVTWTASAGSAHTIDTVPWNSFLSAEYTIHISHSTGIQSEKLLVMCDGTTGSDHHTEYAVMYSGSVLGTFSTTTSGSDVLVRFNPANAGSTTIKFIKSIVQ